jgi:hypothetical protein
VSSRLKRRWPTHVALSRVLAASPANCRFRSVRAMLKQQRLFRSGLRASGLLARCPYAIYAGAISQVAAIYNVSDVSGVFVLDWVPSHQPLAKLAFEHLPPWSGVRSGVRSEMRPALQLVRFSRSRASRGHSVKAKEEHVTCSCHEL